MIASLILATAVCVPTQQAHETLAEKHSESRIVAALSNEGAVLEIWASPDGTWTALVTRPDGLSCPIGAGQAIATFTVTEGEPA